MNQNFLIKIEQNLATIQAKYYKQMYVHDYRYGKNVKDFSSKVNAAYINVNIELSQKLKPISQQKRKYYLTEFLFDIINERQENIICLDYFEVLFHPDMAINPFQLFRDISRSKILIISWRGTIQDNTLIHAEPGHPEFKKHQIDDAVIIK